MLCAERSEGKAREFLNLLEHYKAGLGSNVPFKICRTCQHWVGRCQQIARTHHPECFEVTTTGGKNTRAKNAVFLQSHVPVDDRAFLTKVSGPQWAMRSGESSGCGACHRHLPDRVENVTRFIRCALHSQVHNLRAFVNNTTDHARGNLALLPKVPRPQFVVGEHVDVLRQTQPGVNKEGGRAQVVAIEPQPDGEFMFEVRFVLRQGTDKVTAGLLRRIGEASDRSRRSTSGVPAQSEAERLRQELADERERAMRSLAA